MFRTHTLISLLQYLERLWRADLHSNLAIIVLALDACGHSQTKISLFFYPCISWAVLGPRLGGLFKSVVLNLF